jgi:hypothetical protein
LFYYQFFLILKNEKKWHTKNHWYEHVKRKNWNKFLTCEIFLEKLKCVGVSLEDKDNVQFDDMKRKIWKGYNMELSSCTPYI